MFDFYATYIVPASGLIPIFIGLKNYRFLPSAFRILLGFIIFGSVINLVALVMLAYNYYTVSILHLYAMVEFTCLTLLFSRIFEKKWQIPMYILIFLFDAFCIINYLFIQNKIEFNTYTRPIGAFVVVVFCMCYIIKNGNEEKKWTDDNFNWINTGLLMYYAVGFVVFISFNFFLKRSIFTDIVWTFHDTVLLIEYILFAIGFSKCRSQTTTIPRS